MLKATAILKRVDKFIQKLKVGFFFKIQSKIGKSTTFLTEYCDLNFPPLSSSKKFPPSCALIICYCFFKLWRAVKKVVDFPNSTLNYKITPPLLKKALFLLKKQFCYLRTYLVVDHFHLLGTLHEDYLRELLTTLGDRFSHDDVDELYKEAPIKNGQFDFVEFTRILKHGAKDPDDK